MRRPLPFSLLPSLCSSPQSIRRPTTGFPARSPGSSRGGSVGISFRTFTIQKPPTPPCVSLHREEDSILRGTWASSGKFVVWQHSTYPRGIRLSTLVFSLPNTRLLPIHRRVSGHRGFHKANGKDRPVVKSIRLTTRTSKSRESLPLPSTSTHQGNARAHFSLDTTNFLSG